MDYAFYSLEIDRLSGYPANDFINNSVRSYQSIIHPEDQYSFNHTIIEAIKSNEPWEVEYRINYIDGTNRWVYEKGRAVTNQNGEVEFLDGFILDITERKKSEKDLVESQQLFQTLSQMSPVGIFRTDPRGYYTYVNPKWSELTGFTITNAIGNGWITSIHPEDREEIRDIWQTCIRERRKFTAEYRYLKNDGDITWVICIAVPEVINNEFKGFVEQIPMLPNELKQRKHLGRARRSLEVLLKA